MVYIALFFSQIIIVLIQVLPVSIANMLYLLM